MNRDIELRWRIIEIPSCMGECLGCCLMTSTEKPGFNISKYPCQYYDWVYSTQTNLIRIGAGNGYADELLILVGILPCPSRIIEILWVSLRASRQRIMRLLVLIPGQAMAMPL